MLSEWLTGTLRAVRATQHCRGACTRLRLPIQQMVVWCGPTVSTLRSMRLVITRIGRQCSLASLSVSVQTDRTHNVAVLPLLRQRQHRVASVTSNISMTMTTTMMEAAAVAAATATVGSRGRRGTAVARCSRSTISKATRSVAHFTILHATAAHKAAVFVPHSPHTSAILAPKVLCA